MIGDRVRKAREYGKFSLDNFSEKLGISKRTLQNYEKNSSEPNASTILNIANICHIDEWWLLTGKGEMLEKDKKSNIKKAETVIVNLYEDVRASAGYGAFNTNIIPKPMEFDKNFLRHFFNLSSFSDIDIIRVTGDSMLPHIQDGEYVLVQREIQARNGDTVIACFDGELYIKRFKKISPLEKWFKLESDNKDYPNIDIDTEDKLEACSIVAIVKSKIKIY